MDTEWTGQDSETSAPSPVLGTAGLLVRQKEAGGVSKEAAGFGEEVYTVLTPESRGPGTRRSTLGDLVDLKFLPMILNFIVLNCFLVSKND